jgi:hypothetical protein
VDEKLGVRLGDQKEDSPDLDPFGEVYAIVLDEPDLALDVLQAVAAFLELRQNRLYAVLGRIGRLFRFRRGIAR